MKISFSLLFFCFISGCSHTAVLHSEDYQGPVSNVLVQTNLGTVKTKLGGACEKGDWEWLSVDELTFDFVKLIKTPSGKRLSIYNGWNDVSGYNEKICKVTSDFVPEEGKDYLYYPEMKGKYCVVYISEIKLNLEHETDIGAMIMWNELVKEETSERKRVVLSSCG